MKPSTKDQVAGTLHEVKGTVVKAAGKVTNSPDLMRKGQAEAVAGKVMKKIGQIERVLEK